MTPNYYDPMTQKYYFAECTFNESELFARQMIEGRCILLFDPNLDIFVHPDTQEKYWEFESIDAYRSAWEESRHKVLELELAEIAEKTPIYFDKKHKRWFYPICALTEVEMAPRKTKKTGKPPISYNKVQGKGYVS